MTEARARIVEECRRQEESCLYTSTTLHEWLKGLRWLRVFFVVAPIVCGALAASPLVGEAQGWLSWGAPIAGLIAGVIPAIYKALDFDVSLGAVTAAANNFKVLQDRFRQTASITATGDAQELEKEFRELMDRLDSVRAASPVAPERFFKRAQKKVKAGDYTFTVDGAQTTHRSPNR